MSERSYRRNCALGVTGPNTYTCYPQAFDRITPESSVSTYTYKQYRSVMKVWEENPSRDLNSNRHNAITAELYALIAQDLGNFCLGDMVFEYAHRATRLARILDRLFEADYRPVIDLVSRVGEPHSVGVRQVDEGLYWLVGFSIPAPIRNQPVTAEDIEPFHFDSGYVKNPRWSFIGRNISALPIPN